LIGRATTDTLTNKTIDTAGTNTLKINGNTLAATAGTATLTFPNSTDTIVGRATTDTLTNKTIDAASNTIKVNGNTLAGVAGSGTITFPAATDTVVLLAAAQTLTNKTLTTDMYAMTVPTASGLANGTLISAVSAGTTISLANAVYLANTAKWQLAAADTAGAFPCRGIAVTAGTNNTPIDVMVFGLIRNSSWAWTPGGDIYLSTAGTFSQTAPSTSGQIVQKVGYAVAATTMFVNVGAGDYVTIA
jgi:hypothetical protein